MLVAWAVIPEDANGNIIYIPLATLGLMYVLYLVAVLPTAFVNCYKQKKLKQVNLDIMWSFFWSGMWQAPAWSMHESTTEHVYTTLRRFAVMHACSTEHLLLCGRCVW